MKKSALLACYLAFACVSLANPRLPGIFGNNMVLQRERPIPIWGWATPGEKISIRFHAQTVSVKTGKDGKWIARLQPEAAGGPFTLTIQGNSRLSLENVMVGEVWLCSGQSNMEMPIASWGFVEHYQEEINQANYPAIRQIKIPTEISLEPRDDIKPADWKVCSPETAGSFTAAGYFFARELYKRLGISVGLINSSWGGTMVETWISRGAFEKSDEFRQMIASMKVQDLEVLIKQRQDAMARKIDSLQSGVKDQASPDTWANAGLDDSRWPRMSLPSLWEQRGLDGLDGVVWFRHHLTLTATEAAQPASISLCKIDDSDDSYLNGTRIGGLKNKYNEPRLYTIPAGTLHAGDNLIAVRVDDTGGGGGIYGDKSDLYLTVGDKKIPLDGDWSFRIEKLTTGSTAVGPNSFPTLLFNAMINPLIPYAIRGVIWYQGETNAGRAVEYRQSFPLLISDWRGRWNEGDFPFYFVQLSSFGSPDANAATGSDWAELREAQTMTLSLPATGMAVTTDIGNGADIHPKNKQEVGRRLALIALNNVYGQPQEISGPRYQSMQAEGNKIRIQFSHADKLVVKDKYGYLRGFEIAGADQAFRYAKAYVDGNSVVVYADDIPAPVAVRYAWADDAGEANLYNGDHLPAVPFRTDHWAEKTAGVKYAVGE